MSIFIGHILPISEHIIEYVAALVFDRASITWNKYGLTSHATQRLLK
jgi:hypothetical protein